MYEWNYYRLRGKLMKWRILWYAIFESICKQFIPATAIKAIIIRQQRILVVIAADKLNKRIEISYPKFTLSPIR